MEIIIVAHNIRSTYNIGSIMRTADGFGVRSMILTGYTPYPMQTNDTRLPHIRDKITRQIHKTALGAEDMVSHEYSEELEPVLFRLKNEGYQLIALEQDEKATLLPHSSFTQKIALLLGEEVQGIDRSVLALCDAIIEIPMQGGKESFNVSVATGIALYELAVGRINRS